MNSATNVVYSRRASSTAPSRCTRSTPAARAIASQQVFVRAQVPAVFRGGNGYVWLHYLAERNPIKVPERIALARSAVEFTLSRLIQAGRLSPGPRGRTAVLRGPQEAFW
jgi:hypothetical protein